MNISSPISICLIKLIERDAETWLIIGSVLNKIEEDETTSISSEITEDFTILLVSENFLEA